MKWENLFSRIERISPAEAKQYLESRATDSYQLVDVRQPEEYAKGHLPGADSLPLSELLAGRGSLGGQKKTLVYSQTGKRGLAAVQWLLGQAFTEVSLIDGGFDAWQGQSASGYYQLNLDLLPRDTEFPNAFRMAYAMEEGLRQFYMALARETSDHEYKKLYGRLAGFEAIHKRQLDDSYRESTGKTFFAGKPLEAGDQIMEGGGQADITLLKTLADPQDLLEIFSLAMALETQSYDFYVRLARQSSRAKVRRFLLEMADEEKKHLAFLARELDRFLRDRDGYRPQVEGI